MPFTRHPKKFWYAYGTAPNAYLAAQAHRLHAGQRVLVPGDGEGRNGVWLAEQGLDVLAVDLSAEGLRKATALAAERGVPLRTEQADLAAWNWPEAAFDVVAVIYLHFPPEMRRRLHRAMLAALKPGGLLVLEAFRLEQLRYQAEHDSGGPPKEDMLYDAVMLREDFPGAEMLDLEETTTELREGAFHAGPAAVVRGVFRR